VLADYADRSGAKGARQMSTNTGFGSIHSSLLSLAAKSLGGNAWVRRVRPLSEAEMADASLPAPGTRSRPRFEPVLMPRMRRVCAREQVRRCGARPGADAAQGADCVRRHRERVYGCV
jgi:hypothetical protein